MNKIRKFSSLCALVALATIALVRETKAQNSTYAGAQTGNFSYKNVPIPMPFTYLAPSTATNLAGGWTNTVVTTNIQSLWSASAAAFQNVTNTVTNTSVVYPVIDVRGQRNLDFQWEFNMGAASTANMIVYLAPSVTGQNFQTNNPYICGFKANGTALQVTGTNLDIGGIGYFLVMTVTNSDGSGYLTNNGMFYGATPHAGNAK